MNLNEYKDTARSLFYTGMDEIIEIQSCESDEGVQSDVSVCVSNLSCG